MEIIASSLVISWPGNKIPVQALKISWTISGGRATGPRIRSRSTLDHHPIQNVNPKWRRTGMLTAGG